MKYVNSLKYTDSFESAVCTADISIKRTAVLCDQLGRVHVGTNPIYIPRGASGYAAAVMLESVIKSAGYKVGRITSEFGADSRAAVYLDGNIADIECYNRAVAELKDAVLKTSELKYLKEEIVFALSLLLCKMHGCEYIILQGLSIGNCELSALCAPYELVVVPTAQNAADGYAAEISEAIKKGVREVVSGNQKKSVYDIISKACVIGGVRLNFTSKTSFKTDAISSIKSQFSYKERTGYSLKSPSVILRDCAMLVIESALAIRRDGVKMPWTSIEQGLASASSMGLFETLSVSPLLVFDSAGGVDEVVSLISVLDEVFGVELPEALTLCIPEAQKETASLFGTRKIRLVAVGDEMCENDGTVYCSSIKDAARLLLERMRSGENIVVYGSVAFETELKLELTRLMMG